MCHDIDVMCLLQESGDKLIAAVSQTRAWPVSPVRCLAWHPHCTKLAVAAWDDSVHVFSSNTFLTPILKCKSQRAVSSMAWRFEITLLYLYFTH